MSGHELESQAAHNVLFAEQMTVRSARTMRAIANEFEGVQVRLLDDRVRGDADLQAQILNDREARAGVGNTFTPHSSLAIYSRAMQRPTDEAWFPFVVVTAEPDGDGTSTKFDDYMAKVQASWAEQTAAREAIAAQATPKPGIFRQALGRLGLSR